MRIGLLGFGSMGKTHAYCVQNLKYFFDIDALSKIGADKIEIVSVCTRSIENAKKYASAYGFNGYTTNEDDIINDPTIDAIDVCTPNIYHYETVKKAINAGKHVYCEKPLAVSYAQASELAMLAKQKGVKIFIRGNHDIGGKVLIKLEMHCLKNPMLYKMIA
jgi:predicted dehydrogenase